MEDNEFSGLGEEIKTSVQDAINNGDFSRLNSQMRSSVNIALNEIKYSLGNVSEELRSQWEASKRNSGLGGPDQAGGSGGAAGGFGSAGGSAGAAGGFSGAGGSGGAAGGFSGAGGAGAAGGFGSAGGSGGAAGGFSGAGGSAGAAGGFSGAGGSAEFAGGRGKRWTTWNVSPPPSSGTSAGGQGGYSGTGGAANQGREARANYKYQERAARPGGRYQGQGGAAAGYQGRTGYQAQDGAVYAGKGGKPAPVWKNLPVRPIGKVSGVLFSVFGSILFGIGMILLIVFGSLGTVVDADMFWLFTTLGLPMTLGGLSMLGVGRKRYKRLARMNSYVKLAGEKGYCTLKELAQRTGRSVRYVVKDIKKMMRIGMLPEAHMDQQRTCFILDNKTHQLYLDMMKSRQEAEMEQEQEQEQEAAPEQEAGKEREEAQKVVQEGRDYIGQLRLANAAIPGVEISKKLDMLSTIMDKIFIFIEGHPQKVEEIRRFMNYYLPTTLKLVNAYREFDAQPVQGENIRTAKKEIEETLDTIIEAFSRLFDNLFAEAAMDISTDIDVLQAMFAQEGLTGHSFMGKEDAEGK